jgi:transcriptional regulator with XRE-family HTH domain
MMGAPKEPSGKARGWSREESNFLRSHLQADSAWIAQEIGRSKSAVDQRKFVIRSESRPPDGTDRAIIELFPTSTRKEIAELLGISFEQASRRTRSLQVRGLLPLKKERWTGEEDELILEKYGELGRRGVARETGRSADGVACRASTLGAGKTGRSADGVAHGANMLGAGKRTDRRWPDANDAFLRENHDKMTLRELSVALQKSPPTVKNHAGKLGLKIMKRTPKRYSQELSPEEKDVAPWYSPDRNGDRRSMGDKLAALRLASGKSAHAVALSGGISQKQVKHVEEGVANYAVDTLIGYARGLGLRVEFLPGSE